MAYRKFRAQQLFDGYQLRTDGTTLVTDEKGVILDLIPSADAGEDVQELQGILSPGFVNCHCHLELSHMQGLIEEGTGLTDFVFRVVTQRHLEETLILQAIAEAEERMYQYGIVAVGDICNNELTLPQKKKQRLLYHNFIEASGFDPAVADTRFARSLAFYEAYTAFSGATRNSIVPHAPYSVSEKLWELITGFTANKLLTIHNQETAAEDELFIHRSGAFLDLYQRMGIDTGFFQATRKRSLPSYLHRFRTDQSVILVHNVHTNVEDVMLAEESGLSIHWCLCPNANRYISRQLPDIPLLAKQKGKVVLGTDSLASNQDLSIASEIRTIRHHFADIPVRDMLGWATINGAKALQMDKLLGSFETGKQPGIIRIDTDFRTSERLL